VTILRDEKGRFNRGSLRHDLPVLSRYAVDPETGCWLWLGNINQGYGRCKIANRTTVAHRVFYEHHVGPIPPGTELDHLCRMRSCVNPAHLEAVTRAENVRRGAATKLTAEQVREIRVEMERLCEKYGVKPRTLAVIAEGSVWKGV
jgi:hypothetical protein